VVLLVLRHNDDDVVTEIDIHEALSVAAKAGSVGSCRLLWGGFSRRGRRRYFTTTITLPCPLHAAAWCWQLLDIVRLSIEEFKWNINQTDGSGNTPLCCSTYKPRPSGNGTLSSGQWCKCLAALPPFKSSRVW
jgi:hypothetical protein